MGVTLNPDNDHSPYLEELTHTHIVMFQSHLGTLHRFIDL